ncbi:AraC family transcriptional regulator [Aliifodinibius sp. S!AR15-10]|uniref:helix-turn-helix domain-containing protein n=1 Tax=Aliifodinibius sp. S!AR15-10 TaxID=2950437 RepID=UPI0028556363|nr:AraC family transcriptional regulator [Aliifodinibius sp. S!AR15-10]MDR8394658.1 AraC family transcriptional regulator [Aliifodinibius sp. S!AR15-10]
MGDDIRKAERILANYRSELPEPDPDWPDEVQRVIECIHEHLYRPNLKVCWLKEQCYINGTHFTTLFKYYTGMGLKKYIQYHRLKVAKQVLSEDSLKDITILQVALALGYSGKGAFIHAFKKLQNDPPGKWRTKQFA